VFEFGELFYDIFTDIAEELETEPVIKYDVLINRLSKRHNTRYVEECVDFLLNNKFVKIVSKNKNLRKSYIQLVNKPVIIKKDKDTGKKTIQLVLSYPPYNKLGLETYLKKNKIYYTETLESFLTLIKTAKEKIQICSPFIDYEGFSLLKDELNKKMMNGISVDLLTRIEQQNTQYLRLNELSKILSSIKHHKNKFRIFNYYYQQEGYLASSTHAKIMIIDEKVAYAGSGEIRKNSFKKNLEVGFVIKDTDIVQDLSKILNYMIQVSEEVKFQ